MRRPPAARCGGALRPSIDRRKRSFQAMLGDAKETVVTQEAVGRAIRLRQRLAPALAMMLGLFLIFTCFRAGLLAFSPAARDGVTSAQILRCLTIGARFDGFAVGYAAMPLALALALAPAEAFGRRWFRRTVAAYAAAVVSLLVFLEIIGTCYFAYYGYRLNWEAMQYLRNPREVVGFIWENYPAVWVLAGAVTLAAVLYLAARRLFWRGQPPSNHLWLRALLAAGLSAGCVVAIRGGFQSMPLRIGASGISDNGELNQLALNGIFNLVDGVRSQTRGGRTELKNYPFPPPARAAEVARRMFFQKQDVDLQAPGNPLWRRTVTGRPAEDYNVVVMMLESMTGKGVGAMGYSPSFTPNFDAICREGLFFDHAYAVGRRTNRAIVGTLCGHPDMAGQSVMFRPAAQGRFLNLPGYFRRRGYKTVFIYGGRPQWDNIRGFLSHDAIEEFLAQDEGLPPELGSNWGLPDEVTFRAAHERFEKYGDQKFFAVVLNISNHEPFAIPPGRVPTVPEGTPDAKVLNATRYADWAMGEFFALARQAEYFKRTIFVLVADHGRQELSQGHLVGVPNYRVPLAFYAPGIIPPGRVSTIVSQSDIPPTVLALLGGEFDHCFLGRNALAVEEGDGFALLQHDVGWLALVRGDDAVTMWRKSKAELQSIDPAGREVLPLDDPALAARLQEEMLSAYYVAMSLYWDGLYCEQASPSPAQQRGPPEGGSAGR